MCYEVTHEKDMQNLKIKRDCGRARNAQGSPKAGARAIFVQKNLAQPQYVARPKPGFVFHIGGWSSIFINRLEFNSHYVWIPIPLW
jgi:hypothetical protein